MKTTCLRLGYSTLLQDDEGDPGNHLKWRMARNDYALSQFDHWGFCILQINWPMEKEDENENRIWFRGSFKWTQSIPFHGVDGISTRAEMRPDGVAFYANLFCHVMMSMSNATSWQDCYCGHLSTVDSCVLLEHCWVLLRSFGPPFQLSPGQISKWSVWLWNLILVWISCLQVTTLCV